jgi:hypothetical protein
MIEGTIASPRPVELADPGVSDISVAYHSLVPALGAGAAFARVARKVSVAASARPRDYGRRRDFRKSYDLKNARRSALIVSASVVIIPCGKPL